ncbi:TPA: glycosyltransferase, partial [Candidatus Micrarchaeota archaeon]|nr:glycosyltransferase [Candidatus Micrarchaeota archaeon]
NIIKKYNLSNNVEIYVNPSEGKVLELFSRATIYLNPALEHFGINILEAMAAGLPVIVYKEGGQLDFVRHGINGFIAGDNADEWVGYILQLLTDSKLYEKMAKATKETAIKFSWDRVAERFERLIQYFVKGTL